MTQKVVKHIDCPKKWESTNDWDSHRPLLWLALSRTTGNVQELGCGSGSTMLLKKECAKQNRTFGSYESNETYAKKYGNVVTKISNYMDVYLWKPNVLFIDSAPGEQRKELVGLHKSNADVIVVHDTEEGADYVYGMKEILSTFKYRLDYQLEGKPHTTAVSNFIDVTKWIA